MLGLLAAPAITRAAGETVSITTQFGGAFDAWDFTNAAGTPTDGYTVRIVAFSQNQSEVLSLSYNRAWINNQMQVFGSNVTATEGGFPGSFNYEFANNDDFFKGKQAWLVYSDGATLTSAGNFGIVSSSNSSYTIASADPWTTTLQGQFLRNSQGGVVGFGSVTSTDASTGTIRTAAAPTTYLYWDAGEAGLGGAGTWNTTNTVWNTNSSGVAGAGPYAWGTTSGTNFYAGAGLTANFGGTSGTVTVSGTVQTHAGMEFATTGYTLSSGTINLGGATAADNAITVTTGSATISSVLAGSNGMTKAGTGTLTLSGANSFTGTATINAGNLTLSGGSAMADTAAVSLANTAGAILHIAASETIGSLQGGGTTGGNVSIATSQTLTVAETGTNTFSGNITGAGAFTKSGAGTLTLGGSNTYTGTTTISGGTLTLSGGSAIVDTGTINLANTAGVLLNINSSETIGSLQGGGSTGGNVSIAASQTLTVAETGTITFSGNITGSGGLTKTGSGALTLAGVNTFSGTTTINAGTLRLGGAAGADTLSGNITINTGGTLNYVSSNNNQINNTSNITIAGGTFALGGRTEGINALFLTSGNFTVGSGGTLSLSSSSSFTGGNVTSTAADSRINTAGTTTFGNSTFIHNASTSNQGLILGGDVFVQSSATANFNNIGAGPGRISLGGSAKVFDVDSLANMNVNWVIESTNASGTLTKNGTGTLSLNATNTYTGTTTINAGNLTLNGGNAITDAGVVTLANTAGAILHVAASETIGSLRGGGSTGGDVSIVASQTLTVAETGSNTFGGIISGGGALTKSGAGTMILSGANTYTGATTISAGILQIGNAGTTGALSTSSAITNNAGLVFNRTDTVTQGTHFSNNIGGTGTLTQNGTGTLVLNTSNSYTGATTINSGTIQVTNASALGTIAAGTTVASGAVLELSGGITIGAEALALSGTGSSSGGALRSTSGNNEYQGPVTLNAASRINSDAGTLTLSGAIGGTNQNITFGGAGNILVTNAIGTGTGTLTKDGTGTLTLSAANSYTGSTTISNGNLTLGNSNIISDSSNLIVNTGTLNLANYNESLGSISGSGSIVLGSGTLTSNTTASTTFSGGISGTGDFTKNGTGSLTLSGVNSFNGTATVNGGTLSLGGTLNTDTLTGNIVVNTGGTVNYSSGGDNQINNSSNLLIAGGTFNAGARAETINSMTLTSGTFTKAGDTFSLSSGSAFSGGALNITSSGTLALGAASTFNGTTVTLSHASARINTSGTTTLGTGNFVYDNGATPASQGIILGGNIFVQTGSTANFTNTGAGSGRIDLNGNRVFDVDSGGNLNVGWVVVGTGNSLTKNGTGTLTLSRTNTYTGATTVNNGTLVLSGTNTSSAVTINSGGTLAGTGSAGGTTVNSGGRISPGGSSVGTLATSTLTLNGGGGYTFTIDNVTGSAGTNWDLINVGGGTGLVTINSTGVSPFTVFLNGSPTGWSNSGSYAWNIISSNNLSGFATDKFAVDLTNFNGGSTPTGSFYFSNSGSAIVLNYGIIGDSIWNGGTGDWSNSFTPPVVNTSNIVFDSGSAGTATNNIASATLNTIGNITFNSTAASYTLAAASGSSGFNAATSLTVTGSIVNNSSNAQTIDLAMSFNGNRVVDAAAGNITLGGVIGGAGGLTKNGSNTLTVSADNTFTGAVQINAGTLATTGSGGFASTANITVASGATYSVGVSDSINSLTSPGSLTLSSGTLTISSSTANSNISGAISGSGGLTKTGSSTLTISNNNSGYSGITTLSGGVLEIGNNGALGIGNFVMAGSSTIRSTDATDRTISNAFGTFAGSPSIYTFGSSGTGNLTFSSTTGASIGTGARTFVIDNANTTFAMGFSSTGSITKNGTGTMILTGASTYTGATTINAGILQIGAGSTTGALSTSSTITNNAGLVFNRSNDTTQGTHFANNIGGTGTLTQNGSGTLFLNAANSYSGATTINTGIIRASNNTALGTTAGGVTVASGAALELIGGIAIGAEALSLTGTGISNTGALRNISGANSYAGAITIGGATTIGSDAGTLTLTGGLTGTNTNLTIVGDGATTVSTSGINIGSGTLTKNNAGTLTLNTANTYTGATTINAGTLNAANANALGSTSGVTVNGGSLLVSADDAINGDSIALNKSISGEATAAQASLVFSGAYSNTSGTAGSLTLSQDSIIDLGTGGVIVHFASIANLNSNILHIFNWEGDTVWSGSPGGGKDQFYVGQNLNDTQLGNIRFYSGTTQSSFLSTGFQIIGGSFNQEIVAVPEPETYATALLLLFGLGFYFYRQNSPAKRATALTRPSE